MSCNHNMADQDTAIADGICPLCLTEQVEKLEAENERLMRDRDLAQDQLQATHIALGGDGEWKGRLPPQEPPESGDLHYDVPVLAAEIKQRADQLQAECERLRKERDSLDTQLHHDPQYRQCAKAEAELADQQKQRADTLQAQLDAVRGLTYQIEEEHMAHGGQGCIEDAMEKIRALIQQALNAPEKA